MTRSRSPIRVLAALLVLVAAAALLAVPSVGAATAPEGDLRVTLDGVSVRLLPRTRQVVTVNHTRGHGARVTYWEKRDGAGWHVVRQVRDGRIGYGGLVRGDRRRQGTGTTPLGTHRLIYSFGTHARQDGWDLRHRRIQRGDFWVQDNASRYYNRYRNQRQGGFRWRLPAGHAEASERLTDYRRQYEYSLVLDYNREQVRHRGSGIFLHVNGSGATAGCVSAPRPFLQLLMRRLDPARRPVIAIGR